MRVLLAVVAGFWMMGMALADVALPPGGPVLLPRDQTPACRAAYVLRNKAKFSKQGDAEAAAKQWAIAAAASDCTFLPAGDPVFLVRSRAGDDVVAVRRKGELTEWHIFLADLLTVEEQAAWHRARFGGLPAQRLGRLCSYLPTAAICTALYYNR